MVREAQDGSQYFFVLNYLEEAAEICLKESFLDLFEGKEVQENWNCRLGTKVFARKK